MLVKTYSKRQLEIGFKSVFEEVYILLITLGSHIGDYHLTTSSELAFHSKLQRNNAT